MSSEARLEILTRINRATTRDNPPLERRPILHSARSPAQITTQFAEYAAEYRAQVHQIQASELLALLVELLARKRVVVPEGLPALWLSGIDSTPDSGQSHAELSHFDAVLTRAAVAIAETGTVVLDHSSGQGRRALTLIPDQHVCVVWGHQIVDSVPEAVTALQGSIKLGRPLTWISGPSATSDIELSRVEGVHGPRTLELIVVT